jgi:hypothetical protein
MRNTVSSPQVGAAFGQDIEPAGRYLTEDTSGSWKNPLEDPSGRTKWEYGETHFKSPLVIQAVPDADDPLYGDTGWKARLHGAYGGKRGKALSQALLADGFDGIVTVMPGTSRVPAHTGEIVDLTPVR